MKLCAQRRKWTLFVVTIAVTTGSVLFVDQLLRQKVPWEAERSQATRARIARHNSWNASSSSGQAAGDLLGTGASQGAKSSHGRGCPHRIHSLDDSAVENKSTSGGWAVRRLCEQPIDVLFFVFTVPGNWKRRAHLRATLIEEAAVGLFNWTAVFFVGAQGNPTVALWTTFEAQVMGDVVILPYNDTFPRLLVKFVGGMRWVLKFCPKVRTIIKMDDDISVHPFQLRRYLDEELPRKYSDLHCVVWQGSPVLRGPLHRHCVHEDELILDIYPTYCSGRFIIMTMDIMKKLLVASRIVKAFVTDDAYVTGHLALLANVGHVLINDRIDWSSSDKIKPMLAGRLLCTHEYSTYGLSFGRRAEWGLVLWNYNLKHVRDRKHLELSHRLNDELYRVDFDITRAFLQNGTCIGTCRLRTFINDVVNLPLQ
ncbi:hypothetical protein HPB50_009084 [Hyalomma asiaticum]|uniref:Uncharacterized protein n=1 Tax=Hyalomma asiaticum TaxID=266040 RepID=A0ACB7T3I2_HYAAI|nr:hypothetical protein HPB50_009084 [Hyalomma asiaticum]